MSWHLNQLKYALGLGGMMSFYGIVALIVWLLPPNMVSNQYKIVVIALVLLTLPFALIIMFVSSRRAKKKAKKEAEAKAEAADSTPAAEAVQKPAAPTGNYASLTSSTEEAVQFLKTSNLGTGGRDAVYSLPWFMVAGAPRSGKSSLVLGSNLNFQTLPSQRQAEQKFIRPTGNIDWRVTSDAVFVDTAGRYQSEGLDADEWSALLDTIKKYRGNRPLDGFLLVVDAETIIKGNERETEELAKILRARLDEASQRLKVRFPVYLVFTHADSLEGFRDSFSSSKNEDKTLVWGATIPIEKSENAQALFDGEYELLHNSVMKRRIVRLSAPFPPVRQLRIFNFPLHFGSARRKFGTFVNALFRPNPFSENPFLRGFYFTASPAAKSTGSAPPSVGGSYFSERFFKDVLMRDKDLVKTFLDSRQRPPLFGWIVTFLGGLLVFAALAMSAVSLINNRSMLQDAETRGLSLVRMVKANEGRRTLDKNEEAVRSEIAQIEEMRNLLVKLDDYDRNGPPLHMRFGLYSGNKVFKEHLLPMYLGVVEQRFKEPALAKIQADLNAFATGKPISNPSKPTEEEEKFLEKHLNLLKAYLMLSGKYKEHAQASHVSEAMKEYWISESKTPGDMKAVAELQLDFWAKQIDRDDAGFSRIQIDENLVGSVRDKLKAYPAHFRYLSRKVSEISKVVEDQTDLMRVDNILTRNGADASFMTGTYTVPGAYTRPGLDLMKVAINNAVEEMKKDDWVMGDVGNVDLTTTSVATLIENRYYRDYALHWTQFVRSTDVKPYKNHAEALAALQAFSSPNSPMNALAREIALQTNLSAEVETDDWWPWLKSFFVKKKDEETGSSDPEKEFRPLFQFVGKKDQAENANIAKYTSELGRLMKSLSGISETGMEKVAADMHADKDPLEIRKRESGVATLMSTFNATPSGQEMTTLLQKPIAKLKSLLGQGAKEQVAKMWSDQILPAAKEIEKGYPFETGASEADLKAIAAYLAPKEGKFSKFFDGQLANYFEESNGVYKVKENSELQFNDEFVAYLNNAFALQKALFGSGTEVKFEYEFAFRPVKDALIEITIDGQKTSSEGTGSLKGTFPGTNTSETGVIMKLASTSGSTSTTGNSTDSNSAPGGSSTTSDSIIEQGQWGLFRFVDKGSPEKQPGGEYLLKYSVGGKSVTATIKPIGGDLFNKEAFSKAKAPQGFLR